MGLYLFIIFVIVPVAEIGLFIELGGLLGTLPTIAIIVLTALAGTALLRAQGLSVLHRARAGMAEGRMPVAEVFNGLCLVIAGALLLTPGFLTDSVGLMLFIPPLRAGLAKILLHRLTLAGANDNRQGRGQGQSQSQGQAMEGDYFEIDSDEE